MKILFSHGKKGHPESDKMVHLIEIAENMGFEVDSLDYTETMDPDERLAILLDYYRKDEHESDYLLVGSSMGGYVTLVGSETIHPKGCFLLCPALYIKGYDIKEYEIQKDMHVEIVHGWKDMTVLPEMSMRFAREEHCTLHLMDTDHSMMDVIDYVGYLFEAFLKRFQLSTETSDPT